MLVDLRPSLTTPTSSSNPGNPKMPFRTCFNDASFASHKSISTPNGGLPAARLPVPDTRSLVVGGFTHLPQWARRISVPAGELLGALLSKISTARSCRASVRVCVCDEKRCFAVIRIPFVCLETEVGFQSGLANSSGCRAGGE